MTFTYSENDIIALLLKAFPLCSFQDSIFGKTGTSYPDGETVETAFRNETWSSVAPEILKRYPESIHFIAETQFTKALPAYLYPLVVNTQSNYHLRTSVLTSLTREHHDAIFFDAIVKYLSKEQHQAICSTLKYIAESIRKEEGERLGYVDSRDNYALLALQSYWIN